MTNKCVRQLSYCAEYISNVRQYGRQEAAWVWQRGQWRRCLPSGRKCTHVLHNPLIITMFHDIYFISPLHSMVFILSC